MGQDLIRLLKANEIECRISTINARGLSLLLYKDARVDQRILDETFGAFGWKRSHQCIDGNLYCTVEIFDKETGEWIAKQDVGTMSYSEKEKGQASDSFKRACFNWGIGRELYSAPFIWIPADKTEIREKEGQGKENKFYCYDNFSVKSIEYNTDREISGLTIVNGKGAQVYELKAAGIDGNRKDEGRKEQDKPRKTSISKDQMDSLKAELNRTGVTMETVQSRYNVQEAETMSQELYGKVMSALKRTKSAKAA